MKKKVKKCISGSASGYPRTPEKEESRFTSPKQIKAVHVWVSHFFAVLSVCSVIKLVVKALTFMKDEVSRDPITAVVAVITSQVLRNWERSVQRPQAVRFTDHRMEVFIVTLQFLNSIADLGPVC